MTIQGYVNEKTAALAKAVRESQYASEILRTMTDMTSPAVNYQTATQTELDTLTAKQLQLTQKIRTQRRSFMDQSPQSGTGGYFFHHTEDDTALFVFLIGFILVFYTVYSRYVTSSSWPLRIGGVVLFVISWFSVVQIILRFG
jgi:hypothetical protein